MNDGDNCSNVIWEKSSKVNHYKLTSCRFGTWTERQYFTDDIVLSYFIERWILHFDFDFNIACSQRSKSHEASYVQGMYGAKQAVSIIWTTIGQVHCDGCYRHGDAANVCHIFL